MGKQAAVTAVVTEPRHRVSRRLMSGSAIIIRGTNGAKCIWQAIGSQQVRNRRSERSYEDRKQSNPTAEPLMSTSKHR